MSHLTFHVCVPTVQRIPYLIESFASRSRIAHGTFVKQLEKFEKVESRGPRGHLGALAVLMVFASIGAACKSGSVGSAASGGPASEPRAVRLVPAEERQLSETVVGNGTLAADEDSALAFKVAGRVASIRVDLGSVVRRGDEIGQLDTTDYQLRVQQAEAALQQARVRLGLDPAGTTETVDPETTGTVRQARAVLDEATKNRARGEKLAASGVISKADLDSYESVYRVAEARYQDALEEVRNRQGVLFQRRSELEIARQQLTDTTLRAPFDGAVSERVATPGEYLAAGAKVATLVRLHPLRLRAEIPEREAEGVKTGQAVIVLAEGQTEPSSGRVVRVSPVVNQQNRVLMFEIEVDNSAGRLRPGGYARAEIATSTTKSAVTVPASAVITFAGIQKVIMVKDGQATERNITTGRTEDDRIEVVSGLKAGEQIVADPGNLAAGQPVVLQ